MPDHPSTSYWHTPGVCNRKTIFGRPACKFRPRHDRRDLPVFSENGRFQGIDRIEEVYIRDVCVKCGKTIEREGRK